MCIYVYICTYTYIDTCVFIYTHKHQTYFDLADSRKFVLRQQVCFRHGLCCKGSKAAVVQLSAIF